MGDDVVHPAPHGGGSGGAQLLPHHRTGEDGTVVLEQDAGYLPLPLILAWWPERSLLAGIGRGLPVRVRCGRGWAGPDGEAGQVPPGGVEAVVRQQADRGCRLADVQAMGGDGGGHELLVQAGVAAAAAQDQGEMAAGFGEQVPAMEAPALVHHEHRRGDIDDRQRDVDRGRDSGPDRRSCGAGVLEEGVDDVGGDLGGEDRAHLPPGAQLREWLGLLLGWAGLAGGDLVHLGAGPLGDHRQEPRLAVVVDGGDAALLAENTALREQIAQRSAVVIPLDRAHATRE